MHLKYIIILIILAAIWGSSFLFLHIVSPALGPILTACFRLGLGGAALLVYAFFKREKIEFKNNIKPLVLIGIFNSAIPFSLYSFAALNIPSSYSVIINSTSPIFGAIFSFIFLSEKLSIKKILGVSVGMIGVTLVTLNGDSNIVITKIVILSILACLLAASLYALMGIYIKKNAQGISALNLSCVSQIYAFLFLSPFGFYRANFSLVTIDVIWALLVLAFLCSALAYLLYFHLMKKIGPTKALTVTFLMPVFGMLWGKVFLNEVISVSMIMGTLLIIFGTIFVLKESRQ